MLEFHSSKSSGSNELDFSEYPAEYLPAEIEILTKGAELLRTQGGPNYEIKQTGNIKEGRVRVKIRCDRITTQWIGPDPLLQVFQRGLNATSADRNQEIWLEVQKQIGSLHTDNDGIFHRTQN